MIGLGRAGVPTTAQRNARKGRPATPSPNRVVGISRGVLEPARNAETSRQFTLITYTQGLKAAPRLRWVQTLTAGVEGWLARADLPAALTLTCARGTHRVQMPENILGALFHLTKPFAAAERDQEARRWTRACRSLSRARRSGSSGSGRSARRCARRRPRATVIGTRREPVPVPHVTRVVPPEGIDEILGASDFVPCSCPSRRRRAT
jgi:phosphoglycerate dehydrogenase-like enzyme